MLNISSPQNYSPTFGVNLKSPRLRYSKKDFFIKIKGYGRNENWVNEIVKTADTAVNLIRCNTSAENVMKIISAGVRRANQKTTDLNKKDLTGILRTERPYWMSNGWCDIITPYDKNPKYKVYEDRFDKVFNEPITDLPERNLSRPFIYSMSKKKEIIHASPLTINETLENIFELSKNIFPKYIKQEVKPENLEEINNTIAEIRWLLAHATPWMRGSDAISNVFMRAMYKAIGIKAYPSVKGVSFDLEAYCRSLENYKKNFISFFEKPPVIVE